MACGLGNRRSVQLSYRGDIGVIMRMRFSRKCEERRIGFVWNDMVVSVDIPPKAYDHLRFGCRTDVGRRRSSNEDSLLCLPDQGLFAVADGMGGAQAGEVASRLTVESVQQAFAHYRDRSGINNLARKRELLHKAANTACRKIQEVVRKNHLAQSGSTFAALCFDQNQPALAIALHAGDSRVYRLRKGGVEQLTRDHAFTGRGNGTSSPRHYGVLTRAVGVHPLVELEETRFDVEPGDCYLLCSDGLSNMVGPRQMLAVFSSARCEGPEELALRLVQLANAQGGMDNISVVVVEVGDHPLFAQPRPELAEPAEQEVPVDGMSETRDMPLPAPPSPPPSPPPRAPPRWLWLAAAVVLLAVAGWLIAHH